MRTVTVLVPTLARKERADGIRAALESVLTQEGVRGMPLVIVNGAEWDASLVRELTADPRLRVITIDEPGIPAALTAGRKLVETPWFSELDDDDVMMPGALALRLDALEAHPELDAVVTNGYRRGATAEALSMTDISAVRRDPLTALLSCNWLLPGSWLCRTDRVGVEVFRDMPRFLECTYLAARLASTGRLLLVDQPTVIWHTDIPDSESKSRDFHFGEVAALNRILDLELPEHFRAGIRRKRAEASHSIANRLITEGNPGEAWRWHLRSLTDPSGWRYLLFTRRVIAAMARRLFS